MSSIQTYIGSAFSSYPVRWIETPEAARSGYALDKIPEKTAAIAADPDIGKPRSESGDILDLSPETKRALELSRTDTRIPLENGLSDTKTTEKVASESTESSQTGGKWTPEEQQKIDELRSRDQEVRTHEMAHVAAGGAYVTSGPSYEYELGPDGKGYAVGGSVGIDTSPVGGDPEATIAKMQVVAAAALAPAKPSGQDLKVAAAARQAEAKARSELVQLQAEQPKNNDQMESETVPEFSIVRTANKVAEDAVMPSLVNARTGAASAPSSAYKAQSVMSLAIPRFSAFA